MGVAKLTDQNTQLPESEHALLSRERRYLLQDLPEGLTRASHHLQITDNYITGTRLRLRKVRNPQTNKWTAEFTQKYAPDPSALWRILTTRTYLNANEYEALSIFEANEIRKNRYQLECAGYSCAIDMFIGDLLGLVLAAVSFQTDEEFQNFQQPSFALAEVTNNEVFRGARLCYLNFEHIRAEVKRMGVFSGERIENLEVP